MWYLIIVDGIPGPWTSWTICQQIKIWPILEHRQNNQSCLLILVHILTSDLILSGSCSNIICMTIIYFALTLSSHKELDFKVISSQQEEI